jgi:hypothetical protein
MPDERTYGFSLQDATELANIIGSGEGSYPEIKPRGGGGGGGSPTNYIFIFELKTNFDVGRAASSDIYEVAGDNVGGFVETAPVNDPLAIFTSLLAGDRGICIKQGSLYYAIQAPCPTEYL